jgi:hypothetical protein
MLFGRGLVPAAQDDTAKTSRDRNADTRPATPEGSRKLAGGKRVSAPPPDSRGTPLRPWKGRVVATANVVGHGPCRGYATLPGSKRGGVRIRGWHACGAYPRLIYVTPPGSTPCTAHCVGDDVLTARWCRQRGHAELRQCDRPRMRAIARWLLVLAELHHEALIGLVLVADLEADAAERQPVTATDRPARVDDQFACDTVGTAVGAGTDIAEADRS